MSIENPKKIKPINFDEKTLNMLDEIAAFKGQKRPQILRELIFNYYHGEFRRIKTGE